MSLGYDIKKGSILTSSFPRVTLVQALAIPGGTGGECRAGGRDDLLLPSITLQR